MIGRLESCMARDAPRVGAGVVLLRLGLSILACVALGFTVVLSEASPAGRWLMYRRPRRRLTV
jgi:hypothetical protein